MSSDPRRALLVAFCWFVLLLATVSLGVAVVADQVSPSIEATLRQTDGLFIDVVPGGVAWREGVRRGDRLAAIGEHPFAPDQPFLYDVRAGETLNLTVVRKNEAPRKISLVTQSHGSRRLSALRVGGTNAVDVLGDALRLVVNLVLLGLAVTLLLLRPEMRTARLAALSLAIWCGGNYLLVVPGYGRLFEGSLSFLTVTFVVIDLAFFSLFFAVNLHFGLLFPRPLPYMRWRGASLLPYLLAAPLLLTTMIGAARFLDPPLAKIVPQPPTARVLTTYAPLLLLLEVILLFLHFPSTKEVNDRRRLKLVILSSMPGMLGWFCSIAINLWTTSAVARAVGTTILWGGASLGAVMFAYAIAQGRVFDIRPMVRKSIGYIFARGTLLLLLAMPTVTLVLFLYQHRYESLVSLLDNEAGILIALVLIIALLLRGRQRIFDRIDRRYFRESYDARVTLLRVITMIQRGTDLPVVGRLALTEVQKVLHCAHASLWGRETTGKFICDVAIGEADLVPFRGSDLIQQLSRGEPMEFDRDYVTRSRKINISELTWIRSCAAALIVPIVLDAELIGFLLLGEKKSEEPYSVDEKALLKAIASQLALTADYARLESLARRDALTEALNRHAFYSIMEKRRGAPEQESGCVAIVDLNNLKVINDTEGHAAGDVAIRRVASAIRGVVRADDLVFRWGGDEFLTILFGLSAEEVTRRLQTINDRLASDPDKPVSVSVGVAEFQLAEQISEAIEQADRKMYSQKHGSRGERTAS